MIAWLRGLDPGLWSTLCVQVAAAASMFLMYLFSARLMPISLYGSFSFGLSVGSVVALLCALGHPSLVMRTVAQYSATGDYGLVKGICLYAINRTLVAILIAGLVLLTLVLFSDPLRPELTTGLIFAILVVVLYPPGIIRGNAARGLAAIPCGILPEEVVRPVAFVGLLALASLLVSIDANVSATLFAVAGVLSLAVGLWCLGHKLPFKWNVVSAEYHSDRWRRTSSKMLIGSVFQELLSRTDVIALGIVASMSVAAQYTAAAKVVLISVFFLRVVDVLYAPRIAVAHARADRDALRQAVRQSAQISFVASLPLIVALLAVPEWFLSAFGAEYLEGGSVLRILALGQFVNAATGSVGFALLMTGHESAFVRVVAFSTMLNVAGHLVVTTSFGIMGAAWVTAASVAIQNTLLLLMVYRRLFAPGLNGNG
jgi:O-antigen/teichoic acid export membrane protein